MKKIISILFLIVLSIGLFFLIFWLGRGADFESDGFAENEKELSTDEIEKNIPKDARMIFVDSPKANETIESPLNIEGEARGTWFFEGDFPVKLLSENGDVLAVGVAKALSDWMTTKFVPFELSLNFDPGNSGEGILVFEKSNPSGLSENEDSFSVPVFFKNGDKTVIKVFFGNSIMNPNQVDCWRVYAVNREVEKIPRIAQTAIEELLKGPTDEETEAGYFTSIPEGTELNGVSIQHGVAFVDFNENLDEGVAGSCLVNSIRSQIEQTLMQFPTVEEVQIYIGERIDDVLQP